MWSVWCGVNGVGRIVSGVWSVWCGVNGVGRIVSGVWSVWCGVNGVKGWGEGRNRFRWWYWKGSVRG